MIAAHISRRAESRKAAIANFLGRTDARQIIYVCPKSIMWQAEDLRGRCHVFSFEDLDKRDEWLTVNSMLGPSTALVMEGVTRYPKITSPKFVNLQRLSKQVGDKLLVDHVPFCDGIEYVYTPYSYLDRAILGFAHWYAFREAYDEVAPDGSTVSSHDTQPIVSFPNGETKIVVDGFHRHRVGKEKKNIAERVHGYLPVVEIDKPLHERMASTIRHNRARGKHQVDLMSEMVVKLVNLGRSDIEIAKELGLTADELIRLKAQTGLAKLFENQPYSRSWIAPDGLDDVDEGRDFEDEEAV